MKSKQLLMFLAVFFLAAQPAWAVGNKSWKKHVIAEQHRPIYLFVADMDQDGDPDVVTTTNEHPGLFNSEVTLDVNEDGRKDIIAGGSEGGLIFLNPEAPAVDGAQWQSISMPEDTGSSVYLDDLNGDGKTDILNTLLHGNVSRIDIAYDGQDTTLSRTVIDPDLDMAFDVNCLDVDQDSLKDVLSRFILGFFR